MFDKKSLAAIQRDLEKAFASVAEKYNVKIQFNGGRYTTSYCTLKLDIAKVSTDGVIESKERATAKLYIPDLVDKELKFNNTVYRVTGFRPRARKNPVTVRPVVNPASGGYNMPVDMVRSLVEAYAQN